MKDGLLNPEIFSLKFVNKRVPIFDRHHIPLDDIFWMKLTQLLVFFALCAELHFAPHFFVCFDKWPEVAENYSFEFWNFLKFTPGFLTRLPKQDLQRSSRIFKMPPFTLVVVKRLVVGGG